MKIMILYLFFVSCCSPAIVLSQNVDRIESITEITSTKFKIESQLFQNSRENTLFESEKNNRIGFLKPLSPGTYTSGYILRSDYPWMKNYGVSLALFPLS
ncbi:MAG: hypothetical protein MUD02_11490, partial [Bacteroidales bacterium]|nr:hypothetical protein [Bacteroidales bacterium]